MDLISGEHLPYVVMLILPGVISMKVFDRLVPGDRRDAAQATLEALTYGLLNFGLWYAVLVDVLLPLRQSHPWVFRLGLSGVLVVSPILLAVLTNKVLRWEGLRRWVIHPVPTAWDEYFGRRKPCWILIRLKNGLLIGGLFGDGSFASSYPHRDLYVEQEWRLSETGQFDGPVPQSKGVWVNMADCDALEFFALSDEEEVTKDVEDQGADVPNA